MSQTPLRTFQKPSLDSLKHKVHPQTGLELWGPSPSVPELPRRSRPQGVTLTTSITSPCPSHLQPARARASTAPHRLVTSTHPKICKMALSLDFCFGTGLTLRQSEALRQRLARLPRLAGSQGCRPRTSRRADRVKNGRARGCRAKTPERLRRGHAPSTFPPRGARHKQRRRWKRAVRRVGPGARAPGAEHRPQLRHVLPLPRSQCQPISSCFITRPFLRPLPLLCPAP